MGVKLLGKIKIHEIAKKVGLTSKEVIEKAKELGIAVTSHLSTVEDEQAVRLEQALSNDKIKNVGKKEKKVKEKEIETPVIIRRELIISDDDKKTEKQQENKHSDNRKDVGFVEREKNQNYNIVYKFNTITEAAKVINRNHANICVACKDIHKTCKGLHWQYVE